MIIVILIFLVIEGSFSPRLDLTKNKNLLLHYNNKHGRSYIKIW